MANMHKTPVVYLAGGMRSGWQKIVKDALPGVIFLDPRDHGSKDEKTYTAWDLTAVAMADIVFGYIEKDNPNGAGLAVEFGAAAAQGKFLIYCEEPGFPFSRYFGMVRSISDITCANFRAAMIHLADKVGFEAKFGGFEEPGDPMAGMSFTCKGVPRLG